MTEKNREEERKFTRLIVSTRKEIENLMETALDGFIGLDIDTKDIVIGPLINKCKISAGDKILIGLLGFKALHMMGWRDTDTVSAKELSAKLNLNYNTVRSKLSQLAKDGYVEHHSHGLYALNIRLIKHISEKLIKLKERCDGADER